MFFTAEQQNIISSIISGNFEFTELHFTYIFELWIEKYDECSINDRNCE